MKKVIVIDIETTGLYPEHGDRIIEIAAVPILDEEIVLENAFESFVNPLQQIPPEITQINHITNSMVEDAQTIDIVLPEFFIYIQENPLVAHNALFDIGFLRYYGSSLGLNKIQNRVIDTCNLSRALFVESKHHSLDALLTRLGIPFKSNKRHRALEDACLTARAFLSLRRKLLSIQ
jgi:DNA polymerase-3 subunit epsilon